MLRRKVALTNPKRTLVGTFLCWKLLLLVIAVLSPGIGYDTSTDFLFDNVTATEPPARFNFIPERLVKRLVRWDAIYYVSVAARGPLYEQEWAFGLGFPYLVRGMEKFLFLGSTSGTSLLLMSAAAIVVANISHLLSVLVLYNLASVLANHASRTKFALTVSLLHVFAPAGLFLSAPYGESLYSLLSFCAVWLYWKGNNAALQSASRTLINNVCIIAGGACFGAAALVRSNGVFNGAIFAYDLLALMLRDFRRLHNASTLRHAFCLGLAGSCVALGFIFPQYLAYKEICGGSPSNVGVRPWCRSGLRSVYMFVQEHYWNVGFGRYWTAPNIPLFVLVMPMLWVLLHSSWHTLRGRGAPTIRSDAQWLLHRLAVPQLVLSILAITNFHVQIITRLASGYPLAYLWMASHVVGEQSGRRPLGSVNWPECLVRFTIVYAAVQGGLFASFLPPA